MLKSTVVIKTEMKGLGVTNKRSEMIITEYSKIFFKKGDR